VIVVASWTGGDFGGGVCADSAATAAKPNNVAPAIERGVDVISYLQLQHKRIPVLNARPKPIKGPAVRSLLE
jgi:hypothetical protein